LGRPFSFITTTEEIAMSDDGKIRNGRSDPKTARAIARRRELREINATEVEQITAQLIAGLGRDPIGGEVVAAETIAATLVAGRRLRERGHSDAAERDLLRRLMALAPFGLTPPPPPRIDPAAPGTYFIAEKGGEPVGDELPAPSPAMLQHGKVATDEVDRHNRQAANAALHGYVDPATDEAPDAG
jgi:hypothetical protein